jgi:DNA-binding beta-propeller fold protein YncE
VGNVVYDPTSDRMLVDVQETNELAVIEPSRLIVERRVGLPGCVHNHGLSLDASDRLAFVACDHNVALLTVDLGEWQVINTNRVGPEPDVLAYDPAAHRLYVAAESGEASVLELAGRRGRSARAIWRTGHTSSRPTPRPGTATTPSQWTRTAGPRCWRRLGR